VYKIDDMKNSFYGEIECVFDKFPKYHMTILLEDFNAKVCRDDILIPTIGNESLYEIINANGVRVVNFTTSKNMIVKIKCSYFVTFINLFGHFCWKDSKSK
jgi:hypothetical protein